MRALLKYGHSNFKLEILEYCEPANAVNREQYYINLLKPDYNILKIAGSSLGYKHTEESLAKFRNRKHSPETLEKMSGENHHMFGKSLSQETRNKMSDAKKGQPRTEGAGKPPQAIEVFDKDNNQTTVYESISEAAIALNTPSSRISNYFYKNQKTPYKKRYIFKKL